MLSITGALVRFDSNLNGDARDFSGKGGEVSLKEIISMFLDRMQTIKVYFLVSSLAPAQNLIVWYFLT